MTKSSGKVESIFKTAVSMGISPNQMDEFLNNHPYTRDCVITKVYRPHNLKIEEDDEFDYDEYGEPW